MTLGRVEHVAHADLFQVLHVLDGFSVAQYDAWVNLLRFRTLSLYEVFLKIRAAASIRFSALTVSESLEESQFLKIH